MRRPKSCFMTPCFAGRSDPLSLCWFVQLVMNSLVLGSLMLVTGTVKMNVRRISTRASDLITTCSSSIFCFCLHLCYWQANVVYIANTGPLQPEDALWLCSVRIVVHVPQPKIQTVPVISKETQAGVQEGIHEVTLAHRSLIEVMMEQTPPPLSPWRSLLS